MSVFYDHLVGLDQIHNHLLNLNLPTKKHYELLEIVDSTLHHEVLNVILEDVPQKHHETFLLEFKASPDDPKHLEFIKKFNPDIEQKITAVAITIKARLQEELKV